MKLLPTPWFRLSDDHVVAKTRAVIEKWDRWRIWIVVSQVGLLGAVIWAFSRMIPVLAGLVQPANAPWPLFGFVIGATFGLAFGSMIYSIFHGLLMGLTGFRVERLLLKYYDAQNPQSPEDEPGNEETAAHASQFRNPTQREDPL